MALVVHDDLVDLGFGRIGIGWRWFAGREEHLQVVHQLRRGDDEDDEQHEHEVEQRQETSLREHGRTADRWRKPQASARDDQGRRIIRRLDSETHSHRVSCSCSKNCRWSGEVLKLLSSESRLPGQGGQNEARPSPTALAAARTGNRATGRWSLRRCSWDDGEDQNESWSRVRKALSSCAVTVAGAASVEESSGLNAPPPSNVVCE